MREVEGGFPHSEIHGSKPVRGSPWLIAAYHVLHRLSAPRHPPNALKALDRSHERRSPGTLAYGNCARTSPCPVSMITSVIVPPVHGGSIPSRKTSLLRTHTAPVRSGTNGSRKTATITRIAPILRMHSLFTMSNPRPAAWASPRPPGPRTTLHKGPRRKLFVSALSGRFEWAAARPVRAIRRGGRSALRAFGPGRHSCNHQRRPPCSTPTGPKGRQGRTAAAPVCAPAKAASKMVEPDGIEPTTSCLQSTRSPN